MDFGNSTRVPQGHFGSLYCEVIRLFFVNFFFFFVIFTKNSGGVLIMRQPIDAKPPKSLDYGDLKPEILNSFQKK